MITSGLRVAIKIVSVAPLFGERIMRIHKRVSVSPLFDAVPERVDEAYLHL